MDTPNALDQALDTAFDGTETETEEKVLETETEVEQPEEVKPTEVKEEEEESFTHQNPNDLPEEIKPIYKSLVADYTRKRQIETAELKTVKTENEQLKAEIEQLRQGVNQETEEFEPQGNQPLTAEDVERIFLERQENAWEKQAVLDLPTVDARLDENNPIEYDGALDKLVRAELDEQLIAYEERTGSKLGFNYKQVAEEFLKSHDKKLESLFKSWSQKQSSMVKEKAGSFKRSAPTVSTAKNVKTVAKQSLDSILDEALG